MAFIMDPFFTLRVLNIKLYVPVMGEFQNHIFILGFYSFQTAHAVFEAHEISNGGTESEEDKSENNTDRVSFHMRELYVHYEPFLLFCPAYPPLSPPHAQCLL